MNRKILFSLSMMTLLFSTGVSAGYGGTGIIVPFPSIHTIPCCDPVPTYPGCPLCLDMTPVGVLVSFWVDPGLTAATGLDWAAVRHQQRRSIDAKNAIAELESHLHKDGDTEAEDLGEDTSLNGQDAAAVAPDIVINQIQSDAAPFEGVRQAAETYLFYTDGCQDDCVLERQNTWLLTSIALAAASGDKVLAAAKDDKAVGQKTLQGEFETLLNNFNQQKTPMNAWGANSEITLHTHVQQNDINALYARDLEMNALNGVHESEQTKMIE